MWQTQPTADGFVQIRSVSSGKVVGVPTSGGTAPNLKVRQFPESSGFEQQFKIEDGGLGRKKIVSRSDPNLVLAVKAGFIGRLPDNGSLAHRWHLVPT
jgi:hypothetical protein